MKKTFSLLFLLLLSLGLVGCGDEAEDAGDTANKASITLATTTSTEDSGLLDYILPKFTEETGITVDVIAVGTGQALALGSAGDADVLLVHARAREDEFIEAGDGTSRYDVMYNDFIIIGPANDPAGIKGMQSAPAAFQQIRDTEAQFVSRGDDSGTHTKERTIWAEIGDEPDADWYISAGQGMGAVLTMSGEMQAYTLTDRATYITQVARGLDLKIMVEGDPLLLNPYGVILVNPAKHEDIKATEAQQFVDWLISIETQQRIASYTVNNQQLFFPDSERYRAGQVGEVTSD